MSDEVRRPIDTKASCGQCQFARMVRLNYDRDLLCVLHEADVKAWAEPCFEFRIHPETAGWIRHCCANNITREDQHHDAG